MSAEDEQTHEQVPLYGACVRTAELLATTSSYGSTVYHVAPRCYCLLSRLPCFALLFELLASVLAAERAVRVEEGGEGFGMGAEAAAQLLRRRALEGASGTAGGGGMEIFVDLKGISSLPVPAERPALLALTEDTCQGGSLDTALLRTLSVEADSTMVGQWALGVALSICAPDVLVAMLAAVLNEVRSDGDRLTAIGCCCVHSCPPPRVTRTALLIHTDLLIRIFSGLSSWPARTWAC